MRDVRVERPTAVQFSENGVNQLVRLRIVNIQRQTKKYVTRKVWKEVKKNTTVTQRSSTIKPGEGAKCVLCLMFLCVRDRVYL